MLSGYFLSGVGKEVWAAAKTWCVLFLLRPFLLVFAACAGLPLNMFDTRHVRFLRLRGHFLSAAVFSLCLASIGRISVLEFQTFIRMRKAAKLNFSHHSPAPPAA